MRMITLNDLRHTIDELKKDVNDDIDFAQENNITFKHGKPEIVIGSNAAKLLTSLEFKLSPFAYQVWEVYFSPDNDLTFCILRANQSSFDHALKYVKSNNHVLVWNKQY